MRHIAQHLRAKFRERKGAGVEAGRKIRSRGNLARSHNSPGRAHLGASDHKPDYFKKIVTQCRHTCSKKNNTRAVTVVVVAVVAMPGMVVVMEEEEACTSWIARRGGLFVTRFACHF